MTVALAPTVRAQFAKRLRLLRAQQGYERARHFAKALGIEENRYTRYERAEVEPSLTLIYEICQKLAVTPNELMGFAELEAGKPVPPPPAPAAVPADAVAAEGTRAGDLKAVAWHLAGEVAQLQADLRGRAKPPADPLRLMRDTARIYSRLEQDPFGTVAEIVANPALQDIAADRKLKLASLIEAYTAGVSDGRG
jgi:transcriptional regulator with XRE-family HTH domain